MNLISMHLNDVDFGSGQVVAQAPVVKQGSLVTSYSVKWDKTGHVQPVSAEWIRARMSNSKLQVTRPQSAGTVQDVPQIHQSSLRSDTLSPATAAMIQSVTAMDQYQQRQEALTDNKIPLKLAGNAFRPLAFGMYEKLVGEDRGSIWKKHTIKTEAGSEDWLIYHQDDDGAIIRSLAAGTELPMAKTAVDPSDQVDPMGWTVDESKVPEAPAEAAPPQQTIDSEIQSDLIAITVDPTNKKVDVGFEQPQEQQLGEPAPAEQPPVQQQPPMEQQPAAAPPQQAPQPQESNVVY